MFESIGSFFKKIMKPEQKELLVEATSKDAAKERLHIVLMQDRANVSADFLELMKQEIIDVIKKYIVVDEEQIDVRLTNQENEDGTTGAPALYANIPILNIRNDIKGEILNSNSTVVNVIENPDEVSDMQDENQTPINQEKNTEFLEQPEKQEDAKESEKNEEVEQEQQQEEQTSNSEIQNKEGDSSKKDIDLEDDDELDDDVTFDDLLKVAEEEERQKNISKAKKTTTPKKKSASMGRPKKKTTTTTKKATTAKKTTKSTTKKN